MIRGDSAPALGADEQRPVVGQVEGAERDVIGNQLIDLRQQRDHALLAAFAGHGQGVAGAEIGALEPQRFGDAQAAAIEQRQHRGIARMNPGLAPVAGRNVGIGDALGGGDRAAAAARSCRFSARARR